MTDSYTAIAKLVEAYTWDDDIGPVRDPSFVAQKHHLFSFVPGRQQRPYPLIDAQQAAGSISDTESDLEPLDADLEALDADLENIVDYSPNTDEIEDTTEQDHVVMVCITEPIDNDLAGLDEESHDTTKLDADLEDLPSPPLSTPQESHIPLILTATTAPSAMRIPRSFKEAMRTPEAKDWEASFWKEIQNLINKGVFIVVPLPPGKKALSSKPVNRIKEHPDGSIKSFKTRIVVQGHLQQPGLDYDETWAGVANATSVRILFALMAILALKARQVDIATAFLNALLGKDEELYVRPPPPVQLPPGHVWKLIKALYGLVQAPRAWFRELKKVLINLGFRVSSFDPCVYINDTSKLIITVWVDDLRVYGPTYEAIDGFLEKLAKIFQITNEDADSTYLGMQIDTKQPGKVILHQAAYVRKILDRFEISNVTPARTPGDSNVKLNKSATEASAEYRSLYLRKFGSLNYLPTMTRPDLSHALSLCGRYNANPDQSHMDAMDRIYAYLSNSQSLGITYENIETVELVGYVDSDYLGCVDTRRSTTGWVFMLANGPVSWSSRRQDTVSLSSTEAEYVAATEAVKEAVWLRRFINDLRLPGVQLPSVKLHIDNRSAIKLANNPENHRRTKHIDAKHHYIREVVESGEVVIEWIGTEHNTADMFTKPLSRFIFEKMRTRLNMTTGRM